MSFHFVKLGELFKRQPMIDAFVEIMDDLTKSKNCVCWAKKTPSHIFVLNYIEKVSM